MLYYFSKSLPLWFETTQKLRIFFWYFHSTLLWVVTRETHIIEILDRSPSVCSYKHPLTPKYFLQFFLLFPKNYHTLLENCYPTWDFYPLWLCHTHKASKFFSFNKSKWQLIYCNHFCRVLLHAFTLKVVNTIFSIKLVSPFAPFNIFKTKNFFLFRTRILLAWRIFEAPMCKMSQHGLCTIILWMTCTCSPTPFASCPNLIFSFIFNKLRPTRRCFVTYPTITTIICMRHSSLFF